MKYSLFLSFIITKITGKFTPFRRIFENTPFVRKQSIIEYPKLSYDNLSEQEIIEIALKYNYKATFSGLTNKWANVFNNPFKILILQKY